MRKGAPTIARLALSGKIAGFRFLGFVLRAKEFKVRPQKASCSRLIVSACQTGEQKHSKCRRRYFFSVAEKSTGLCKRLRTIEEQKLHGKLRTEEVLGFCSGASIEKTALGGPFDMLLRSGMRGFVVERTGLAPKGFALGSLELWPIRSWDTVRCDRFPGQEFTKTRIPNYRRDPRAGSRGSCGCDVCRS